MLISTMAEVLHKKKNTKEVSKVYGLFKKTEQKINPCGTLIEASINTIRIAEVIWDPLFGFPLFNCPDNYRLKYGLPSCFWDSPDKIFPKLQIYPHGSFFRSRYEDQLSWLQRDVKITILEE